MLGKRGEVQKGFLLTVVILLGATLLVSYLNSDGTGYATSSWRRSPDANMGITSTQSPACECVAIADYREDKKTTKSVTCPYGGDDGVETCWYKCRPMWEGNSCTLAVRETNTAQGDTILTSLTSVWAEKPYRCITTCRADPRNPK